MPSARIRRRGPAAASRRSRRRCERPADRVGRPRPAPAPWSSRGSRTPARRCPTRSHHVRQGGRRHRGALGPATPGAASPAHARRCREHHDPVAAAAPDGVPGAAGKHPQLRGRRLRAPRRERRCAAPRARAHRRRDDIRRAVASAAVRRWCKPGRGDVADAPAGGGVATDPILLIAATRTALSSNGPTRSNARDRIAMFAPQTKLGVAIVRRRDRATDRRRFTSAVAWAAAFEQRPDRPAEDVDVRRCSHAGEQRREPPIRRQDVVVDEHDQLAVRGRRAGVTSRVQAARDGQRDEPARWRCADRGDRGVGHRR